MISTRSTKRGEIEIYPKFIIKKSSDLMIRGKDFYAIWLDDKGLWSTDENDAIRLIDKELDIFAEEYNKKFNSNAHVLHLWDAETGMIDRWHKYCQQQLRDSYHMLDEKLIFSNSGTNKKDYASKRLSYPLEEGSIDAYDKLISTLYIPAERLKLEWAIGSIVTGDSKKLQKFIVLYGAAGTGKSTILNIIQQLFDGYFAVFDAKALGSASGRFALEPFKINPLVAIQHDGDLSRIEDNTRLNSLVSHEIMTVDEKFKSTYSNSFKAFLFMGTNRPVKITDAKSGLLRRLIDVTPSGNKLDPKEYKRLYKQVSFELGAIASHCKNVYLENQSAFDDYVPISMMGASNDFYNYVLDSYMIFKKENGVTLKRAYDMYKTYCDEAKVPYPLSRMIFKEELKNYFTDYSERATMEDGTRVRSYYSGFRTDIVDGDTQTNDNEKIVKVADHFIFTEQPSQFDVIGYSYPAQYATDDGKPLHKWSDVVTTLKDISTDRLHYVKVPENHIVIDFDIPDDTGKKSFAKNLEAANKWPLTYAELSKSGQGIHLHYIFNGDASKLSRIYDEHIEIKVFTGNSSLRRKLTKCNDIPIATISSGLPMKGEKMISEKTVKSERGIRNLIERNLNKEIHSSTTQSINFIHDILEEAYNSGITYDVSDLRNAVYRFAIHSTNNKKGCARVYDDMKFKSNPDLERVDDIPYNVLKELPVVYFDIETWPNYFLVCWKLEGLDKPVIAIQNPEPKDIEALLNGFRLRGFNCRRYDNHMLYARMLGYSNEMSYQQSQNIIGNTKMGFFSEAYNVSETDIYDFASAGNKKSLKKLEIEMSKISEEELKEKGFTDDEIAIIKAGTNHMEMSIPWDQPIPDELIPKAIEYCSNDVRATEAAFVYLKADWTARQILADLAGMTVNDTTNTLTTRIIFGKERHPQSEFLYRNLAEPVFELDPEVKKFLEEIFPEMMATTHGEANSLLPYFPGYSYDKGISKYRGEVIGEGGKVYAEPGMYTDVALLDIMSQHPHSTLTECLFGPKYSRAYYDIVYGRVSIKHEAWSDIDEMLDGRLKPYIQKVKDGKMTSGQLANALKTAINSVYGLTAASFDNPFKDKRNIDNIVAKRGALFMTDLKFAVQEKGFTVAHIKTDSIKIPNATPEIIQFVMDFGKKYGYYFEHEATYDRMCLVNDAVYIARYKDGKHAGEWTSTGTQFSVPYVYKTLFSKEKLTFYDFCETFAVSKGDLYLDMNESLDDSSILDKDLEKLIKTAKKENKEPSEYPEYEQLKNDISKCHDYHFVGRVGLFTPVKAGTGGGVLYRKANDKYYAAQGSTGYRWMESDLVKSLNKEDSIDRSFYDNLATNAVNDISKYGDFEWFVSTD